MNDVGHDPGAPRTMVGLARASSLPPALHNLQADLSAKQTGIGRVVPQGARRQVKPVDEGGALVESVVYPEIELRVCVPAGVEFPPTAAVATSSPSPPQWPRVKSSS